MRQKDLRVCLGLLLALSWTIKVHAAEQWHTSTVKFVYPQGDGSVVVGFDQNTTLCPNLELPTQYYFLIEGQADVTAPGMKNLMATILTAFSTGSRLSVAFDDSNALCRIRRALVLR